MPQAPPLLAVVLAGGLGSRIRHLLDGAPKPLAPVAGRPFLEWVVRYLRAQGVRRIVFSAGYQGGQIADFARALDVPDLVLRTVVEPQPLGTGGGLVHAWHEVGRPEGDLLVLNGDSLLLTALGPLLAPRPEREDGALLGVRVDDASRYGTLQVDASQRLLAFGEKLPHADPGLVNAGVYLLPAATVADLPCRAEPLSLEVEVFPALLRQGKHLRVVPAAGPFLDIGTPESLARSDAFVRAHPAWFSTAS